MSLKLPKHLVLWILGGALAGCSSDKDTPSCNYQSKPQTELQASQAPEAMGLPIQQQKLMELMWTSTTQSECFLLKNGNVRLYKVQIQSTTPEDTFVVLKPAPQNAQQNWVNSQGQLSGTLLGLTTFKFYSVPTERIVNSEILLRPDGRPWHLWHEYAHYLIGDLRVKSTTLTLRNPLPGEVRDALNTALTQTTSEEFQRKFLIYSDLQLDYMQKAYLDEVVIEKTIQDLASQAQTLLAVSAQDFQESQDVIDRFFQKYRSYFFRHQQDLKNLLPTLTDEQQQAVLTHLNRMDEQGAALLRLAM